MISNIFLFFASLASTFLFVLSAQTQSFSTYPNVLSVDRLTVDDGLPSNEIRGVYKDRTGFMWFISDRGLIEYNAHDFTIYSRHSKNSNSLSSEELFSLIENDGGVFWIATKNGLNRFDSKANRFYSYQHDPNDPSSLSDNSISSLLQDSHGNFWVGTYLGGLNLFDPDTGKFLAFRHDPNDPNSLSSDIVNQLAEDSSGKIWVGMLRSKYFDRFDPVTKTVEHFGFLMPGETPPDVVCIHIDPSGLIWYGSWGQGLYRYNPADGTYKVYRNDPDDPYSITSNIVQVIERDENGRIWIGTRNGGVCVLDPETERFHPIKLVQKSNPNAIIDTILDMYWDDQGILWFGTLGDGVCRYDSNREQIQYFKNDPKNPGTLCNDSVFALCADPDGSLWIGTDGGGLCRYDPQTDSFTNYLGDSGDPAKLDSKTVISLFLARNGDLWVGSWGSDNAPLCRFDREKQVFQCFSNGELDDSKRYHGSVARNICEDFTGTIWIASESAGLVAFDPKTETFQFYEVGLKGLMITRFRRIFEDCSHRLWIAAEGGLQFYDRPNDRFVDFQLDPQSPVSLPKGLYLTLFEDSCDNLWIGTDMGLFKVDPDRKTAESFTLEDGLADNVVKAILEDASGYLWISMDNGKLTRLDPDTRRVLNFDKSDGLQSLSFTSNCFAKGKNGELYFGGLDGLNCIWPDRITRNAYVPPIVITSFEVMGTPYPFDSDLEKNGRIVLDYFQNFLSFEFAALNYTRSQKNQYRYRLLPLEKEWNQSRTRRYARYTSLQPGDYTLQVAGSNNDAVWNEEGVTVPIRIKAPFWQTFSFKCGVAALILLFVFFRYWDLRNQKKRLEAEVKRQTKELSEANSILERISMQDGMTKLFNRRCFDDHIQKEWLRGVRNQTYLSLLFFDVDLFKKFNDQYGHVAGDDCLIQVAEVLRNSVHRPGDLPARYGGEEFVLVLTDASPDNAVKFAEMMLERIRDLRIPHEASYIDSVVTVSIGVSSCVPSKKSNVSGLISSADRALYRSKEHGRNRVTYIDPAG